MAHIITNIENYDNKRTKVTLDYGEVTFLLYKSEFKSLKLEVDTELSEDLYKKIIEEILLPRAKKRVLYFMKNADKTRFQIRRKLKEGFYPDEVIEGTMDFLDKYGFANDEGYAGDYAEELRGKCSRREIEAKLYARGIDRELIAQTLAAFSCDDEYEAANRALSKKYPDGLTAADRNKAYAFLARKGFSHDSAGHAVNAAMTET